MFYNQIKNMFDKIHPLKRPFIRNSVLAWLFYLLTIASVDLKPQSTIYRLLIISTLSAFFTNILFGYLVSKIRYAYLYYLFIAIGGLCALFALFVGAIEMIGWRNYPLFVFWILCTVSALLLLYVHYVALNESSYKDFVKSKKPSYTWDIDRDIYADANKTHGFLLNLIRNFIAPFAPAFGMALSRSFQGEKEWILIGFLILLLALILSAGYIRFFALSLKLLHWQKVLRSEIRIANPPKFE